MSSLAFNRNSFESSSLLLHYLPRVEFHGEGKLEREGERWERGGEEKGEWLMVHC